MNRLLGGLLAALVLLSPVTALAQKGKPVIAIYQMDDLARTGQAATLSTMIETAIANTSKFRVIERDQLGKLVGEQARAKSGLVTTNTPGKIGGFEGADYLIYGTITTVSLVRKADIGSNFVGALLSQRGSPPPNCNNTFATLGLDIKITDARSGEVRYVNHIDETEKSATACGGAQGQIDVASLFRGAADRVATGLVTTIYPIQVAAVQPDGVIVLNYGEGSVEPGAVMTLFAKGEVIRDPATGEVLANNETKIGYIRVTDVVGRISKAVLISPASATPQIGTIARPASASEVEAISHPRRR